MIYNLLMPYTKEMYITELDKEFEGDTFFPKIDEKIWKETERIKGNPEEPSNIKYEFVTYERCPIGDGPFLDI